MTVIAWDGVSLCADKRAGDDLARTVTKIRRASRDGSLIGCSGSACMDAELMQWYEEGADPSKFPAVQRDPDRNGVMIVITPQKIIKTYIACPIPAVFEDAIHAIGSGRDYAMAAMYLGKNAREAVQVAIDLSPTCGNGIDELKHE